MSVFLSSSIISLSIRRLSSFFSVCRQPYFFSICCLLSLFVYPPSVISLFCLLCRQPSFFSLSAVCHLSFLSTVCNFLSVIYFSGCRQPSFSLYRTRNVRLPVCNFSIYGTISLSDVLSVVCPSASRLSVALLSLLSMQCCTTYKYIHAFGYLKTLQ
jgi:hypothetical protein